MYNMISVAIWPDNNYAFACELSFVHYYTINWC